MSPNGRQHREQDQESVLIICKLLATIVLLVLACLAFAAIQN
jgi:hypothetical protein